MSIKAIITKIGTYLPPALNQEEEKDFARIELPEYLPYHPREKNLSLSKPVEEKLINELRLANEQLEAQKSNPDFIRLAQKSGGTYKPKIDTLQLDNHVAVSHTKGRRSTQEDAHVYYSGQIQKPIRFSYQLFGIIDGHNGDQTALFVKEHIAEEIEKAIEKQDSLSDTNIRNALKEAFVQLDAKIKNKLVTSGAVAVISLKIESDLWTANLGDCRAILKAGDFVIQLSVDAKPNDPRFRGSIEKRGGMVFNGRINGSLAPARAFGDSEMKGGGYYGKYYVVSPRPKITKINLQEIVEPIHLILACDGIWDVATTKDVASIIDENSPPDKLAEDIVQRALKAGSSDNCSTLIARLN